MCDMNGEYEAALIKAKIQHSERCQDANTGRSPFECVCNANKHNAAIDKVLNAKK